ncbi:hypothetical protein [Brevundimonas naejangsanensis]|uniref:hypothetical protein n=1 Tax=Brevundimonas naejangsanensis TaxID=588932 RepID=UPI003CFC40CF
MDQKLISAKDATSRVITATDEATMRLAYFQGRIRNGWNEFSDPSLARTQLREAQLQIQEALNALAVGDKIGWRAHGPDDE